MHRRSLVRDGNVRRRVGGGSAMNLAAARRTSPGIELAAVRLPTSRCDSGHQDSLWGGPSGESTSFQPISSGESCSGSEIQSITILKRADATLDANALS